MLFYIVLVLAVLLVGYSIRCGIVWPETKIGSFFGAIIGLFAGVFASVLLLAMIMSATAFLSPKDKVLEGGTKVSIRALDASTGIEGEFYLRSGYIEEKKVLDYISETDGIIKLGRVPAEDTTLRESDESPVLITRTYHLVNGWVAPGAISTVEEYEFIIPEGSIQEGFAVQ